MGGKHLSSPFYTWTSLSQHHLLNNSSLNELPRYFLLTINIRIYFWTLNSVQWVAREEVWKHLLQIAKEIAGRSLTSSTCTMEPPKRDRCSNEAQVEKESGVRGGKPSKHNVYIMKTDFLSLVFIPNHIMLIIPLRQNNYI